MLSRRICRSVPSGSTMVFSATCEFGRLDVVGQLDVGELGAADHPLLLLDRQRVPGVEVVQVLLHDDVAAAGEVRDPRRRSAAASTAAGPVGFSVPSTKPSRSRSSKYLKPCTSSTTSAPRPEPPA